MKPNFTFLSTALYEILLEIAPDKVDYTTRERLDRALSKVAESFSEDTKRGFAVVWMDGKEKITKVARNGLTRDEALKIWRELFLECALEEWGAEQQEDLLKSNAAFNRGWLEWLEQGESDLDLVNPRVVQYSGDVTPMTRIIK